LYVGTADQFPNIEITQIIEESPENVDCLTYEDGVLLNLPESELLLKRVAQEIKT